MFVRSFSIKCSPLPEQPDETWTNKPQICHWDSTLITLSLFYFFKMLKILPVHYRVINFQCMTANKQLRLFCSNYTPLDSYGQVLVLIPKTCRYNLL